jgi:hypothetical protein
MRIWWISTRDPRKVVTASEGSAEGLEGGGGGGGRGQPGFFCFFFHCRHWFLKSKPRTCVLSLWRHGVKPSNTPWIPSSTSKALIPSIPRFVFDDSGAKPHLFFFFQGGCYVLIARVALHDLYLESNWSGHNPLSRYALYSTFWQDFQMEKELLQNHSKRNQRQSNYNFLSDQGRKRVSCLNFFRLF